MRISLPLLLATTFAVSASAQSTPPPVVTAITPTHGSPTGGTPVTITGTDLDVPPNFACLLPCPTKVLFGDAEALVSAASRTSISVKTPAHAAGQVDVTVKTGDNRTTTVAKGFFYDQSVEDGYARILLPIYLDLDTPGSGGSLWRTDLWIRNGSKTRALLAPWPCLGGPCPAVFPLTRPIETGETLHNLPPSFRLPGQSPALLLYLDLSAAPDVAIQLRIADVSRQASDPGTELPVICDNALLTSTLQLQNITIDNHSRAALRIYDPAAETSRFRIRVYPQAEETTVGPLLGETEIDTHSQETGDFRTTPAYAQILDLRQFFALASPGEVRIEIDPLTPNSRFWSLVSITNNDTQHVTTVTPQ